MGILIDYSLLKIMGIGCAIFTVILVPLLKREIKTKESEYAELEQKVKNVSSCFYIDTLCI